MNNYQQQKEKTLEEFRGTYQNEVKLFSEDLY